MTKRKLAWGAITIAVLVSLVGIGWTFFGVDQITMTQAELQAKIDAKMPHTTANGVKISDVKLDLSGDKIGLSVNASATKWNTEYAIGANTRGTLRYNSIDGTFFFQPDSLTVTNVQANGSNVSDKVGALIDKWVDSKKINDNKAELMAKAQQVAESMVQKSAEVVLAKVPVYTLPHNFKGNVVRVFLKDVEVKNGTVIAHLSLWQFTKMCIFYAFVLVAAIGMTIALFACPEWGVALLVLGSIDS